MNNQFLSGMDSTLSFSINVKNPAGAATTSAFLGKAGGHGAIQRIRIFHGSSLLQDIDDYQTLVAMMMPFQFDSDYMTGKGKILAGTDLLRGTAFGTAGGVIADGVEATLTFNLSLLTILSLCQTYVPCYALTSSPIRLEIQWVSSIAKFVNSNRGLVIPTTAPALFTDIKFIANYVEVSDQGMAIIVGTTGPMVQWSMQSYANYQLNAALTAGIDQVSMAIPAKFNSLKALYFTFRENSAGALNRYADESNTYALSEYSTRIGSNVIPSEKPKSVQEFLSEMHRALGSVGTRIDPHSYSSGQYTKAVSGNDAANLLLSGAFAVGVETESYSSAGMESTYQGLNTSTSDIFGQFAFGGGSGAVNIRIDCFASFDQLVTISNGVAVVQF